MKKILITGANSFVGTSIERWLMREPNNYQVDTVDTMNGVWIQADFSKYDAVFHVAGIAHVDPKPEMAPLYYKVNRDLTIEIAKHAKECGVKQFVFMSSRIVYHASKSLKGDVTKRDTKPNPNDFYGDSKLQAEQGLATKTPIFPAWHNKRSMLFIDNLAEFVKQVIDRELGGTFYPQNAELADTVEIVRFFAKKYNHKIWISRLFNPFVWLGSFFLPQLPKMFASSYYEPEMSKYDFDYQIVSFDESLKGLEISDANRKMK